MAPKLLWIVKTAQSKSLSHSENEERLRVFSQAQRTTRPRKSTVGNNNPQRLSRHRKCCQSLSSRCESSATCATEVQRPEFAAEISSNGSTWLGDLPGLMSHFVYYLNSETTLPTLQPVCLCSKTKCLICLTHTIGSISETCWQNTNTIHRDGHGHRIDPCSPISTQNSAFVWRVIDYFTRMVLPSQNFYDILFDVDSVYGRFALQPMFDEGFHHAGLAALYSTAFQVKDCYDEQAAIELIKYTATAVSKQRTRLQELGGRADELAVRTALSLALLAEAAEDMKSFNIHRNSIEPLIDAAGGIQNLSSNSYARKALCQWDLFWALGNRASYALPDEFGTGHMPQYYPAYPFGTDVGNLVSRLPLGFQKLAEQRLLTLNTLELLDRVVDIGSIKCRQPSGVVSFDCMTSMHTVTRNHRCYWEASPCLSRLSIGTDGVLDLESLVVLTVILYCCHAFLPQRVPVLIYRTARRRLSKDISLALCAYREAYPDFMLWVLMNLVDSWQEVGSHEPGQRALIFFHDVRDLTSDYSSDTELQNALKTFLWDDAFVCRSTQYWK